jgi:hypothetical protein
LKSKLIFPVTVLLIFISFIWWSDQPEFRYNFVGNSQECSVGQILGVKDKTLDFVALGSSRIRRGLSPEDIELASHGDIRFAVNFGRPGRSIARSYQMLEDVLVKKGRIKYAIVEFDLARLLDEPNMQSYKFETNHDNFLEYTTLLSRINFNPSEPLWRRVHASVKSIFIKLRTSLIYFISGKISINGSSKGNRFEKVCWLPNFDEQSPQKKYALEEKRVRMEGGYGPGLYTTATADFNLNDEVSRNLKFFSLELYYMNKIIRLANKHSFKVYFTQLPSSYDPPLSRKAILNIKALVPNFFYPREDLIRANMTFFNDINHMDKHSRKAYSQWIASELIGDFNK